MKLNTASQVISFSRKLEEDGVSFYESLARQYTRDSEVLLGFARENRKNIMRVERAYYGAITDALEGTFAFDINPDEYAIEADAPQNVAYTDVISIANEMERKTAGFYNQAAEQAKSLLVDIPRVFLTMSRLRDDRQQKLADLLNTRNLTK
jgi:rubrerythrin